MIYSLFDGAGNLIDAFVDRDAAMAELKRIAEGDPNVDAPLVIAQESDGNVIDSEKLFR